MKLGIIMDPIQTCDFAKDSSLAMLLEAKKQGYQLYYFEQKDIYVQDGIAYGRSRALTVFNDASHFYDLGSEDIIPLSTLTLILMRKDPPFDMEYIYTTYILEYAERAGVRVINRPQALRDANEKLFAQWFPEVTPPTLVTRDIKIFKQFYATHRDIVLKPLDSMGGASIFRVKEQDVNSDQIFATLTHSGSQTIMCQKFIPEITLGDKRIILINGIPCPYALARIPQKNDWRGNLAFGAKGVAQALSEQDRKICEIVGPVLKEKGLFFVGLDVIGAYLTEVNVTSPTGIRQLEAQTGLNLCADIFA
jgi:glutathione synthase